MAQKIKNNQCKLTNNKWEFVNYLPIHWNLVYPALFYSELPVNRNDDWKNWESLATTINFICSRVCARWLFWRRYSTRRSLVVAHTKHGLKFSVRRGHSLCLTSAVLNRRIISIVFCNQNNIVTKCNAITYSQTYRFF